MFLRLQNLLEPDKLLKEECIPCSFSSPGFLRRRFRSTVLALGTLGLLWSRGGAPQLEAVLIKGMCASVVGSLVLGGFMTLNICSAFAIVQCYRAGIMTFRNPIELINRVRGKRSDDQEEL